MDDEKETWETIGWEGYAENRDTFRFKKSVFKKPRLFREGPPRAIKIGGYNKKEEPQLTDEIPYKLVIEYQCQVCFAVMYNVEQMRRHKIFNHRRDVKVTLRLVGIPNEPIVQPSRRGKQSLLPSKT